MAKRVEERYGWTDKLYYIIRLSTIVMIVMIFFSEFNAGRIFSQMNKNVSLLTAAVSYDRLVVNVIYEIRCGYFLSGDFIRIMISSGMMIVGMLAVGAAACISLGNIKFKKLANFVNLAAALLMSGGVVLMIDTWMLYKQLDADFAAANIKIGYEFATEKLPVALFIIAGLAVLNLITTIIIMIFQPRCVPGTGFEMATKYKLFIMFLPFALCALIFCYLPLYGWRYAFFEYHSSPAPLSLDDFVGLKWFKSLFANEQTRSDIIQVMKNTLIMSGLGIATSWIPMAFAIFISEIKCSWFRRMVQVFTTVPNFISWVLVYAMAFAIFSSDGFLNNLLTMLTGQPHSTLYLQDNSMMYLKMLLWGMWKGVGWSAIIYIAGISGIDVQLYEAATVDGAGRFQKMWYVTLPGLMPTYCVMLLLAVAGILSNGMDQYLVFTNAYTKEQLQVLDLYVYKLGIGAGKIPLSTVVGMLKTIISLALLFIANGISKLVRGDSIV